MSRPPAGLTLERVGAEAAESVYAVVQAAFGARPALDPPADALAETPASLAVSLGRGRGILARLDGEPVGALLLDPRDRTLFLRRFSVLPKAQGQGLAGRLLAEAVAAAPAHEFLTVLARPELPATVAFWESQEFVGTAEHAPFLELRRELETRHAVPDAEAMRDLGHRVGLLLAAGDLVILSGELGAGKTTFTQGLGAGLGVRGQVTSPTFVIARVHPSLVAGPDLVHVDAYRLGGIDELDDLDLDAALDEAVTVVEWGEGIAEGLSQRRLEVRISRAVGGEPADGQGGEPGEELDPRVVELRWVSPATS